MKKLLFIIFFLATNNFYSQKLDSLQIEKEFSSAIGKIEKLDSLEHSIFTKVKSDFVLEDTYWYNLSKTRFLSGDIDKAYLAAERGIALCETKKKTFRKAKFYNLLASVEAYRMNNKKAIEFFKKSLSIVEKEHDFKTAAYIRNNIANIFFGLNNYESAYQYSLLSYNQLVKDKDTMYLPSVAGILAISSLKIGKTKEGIRLANESIELAQRYKSQLGLIVGYHSLGESFIAQKKYEKAIESLNKSLEYSEMSRQNHFIMLNKLALQHAFLMNKEYSKSVEYGLQAKSETKILSNENTMYAIKKNLAYAYEKLGDKELAFKYLSDAHQSYKNYSDVQNQKVINDILIKYDTEKKEKDLVLSRLENSESKNKLYKRAQWIGLLLVVLVLSSLSYLYYNRLQKLRLKQLEKDEESKRLLAIINAEEKERERISNELHDGMASSITGIKLKLEYLSMDENREELAPLVDELRKLHKQTRIMSHNLMPLGLHRENWEDRLQDYCMENSCEQFKINFSNNIKSATPLDIRVSTLLYRSVQELIQNVQKHSQVDSCTVQISKLEDEIIVSIEDEGIGFKCDEAKGQGLASIRKRIAEIGGQLDIDSKPGEGCLITISLNSNL